MNVTGLGPSHAGKCNYNVLNVIIFPFLLPDYKIIVGPSVPDRQVWGRTDKFCQKPARWTGNFERQCVGDIKARADNFSMGQITLKSCLPKGQTTFLAYFIH